MPLVLDATPMSATANALCDRDAAQAVIDETFNTSAWGDDEAEQEKALIAASSQLMNVSYRGCKTVFAQQQPWPRLAVPDPDYDADSDHAFDLNHLVVPRRMVRGCALLALEILRAGTTDLIPLDTTRDVIREKTDVLETEYANPGQRQNVGLRRYIAVWREIYPLTSASVQQTVERA